jgi:hypothetical protein
LGRNGGRNLNKNIAVIAGDGIGPEIVAEAKKVLDRVCEKYGLDPVENCTLCKYSGEYTHKAAGCSVLMRVIGISDILFNEDVPEFVRDFAIYYELQHILLGYDPDRNTEDEFDERVHKFPQYLEAQTIMRRICVYL